MCPELLEGITVTRHGSDECEVYFSKYVGNDRVAVVLVDKKTGEPYATATVNLPDHNLAADEVAIKNYSENEGLLDDLVAAGVVENTGRAFSVGYVTIPVVRLLRKPSWLAWNS